MNIPQLNYSGDFGVYCEAEFNLDKSQKILEVTLSNTKLGMLPIPDSMLGDILKKHLQIRLSAKKKICSSFLFLLKLPLKV